MCIWCVYVSYVASRNAALSALVEGISDTVAALSMSAGSSSTRSAPPPPADSSPSPSGPSAGDLYPSDDSKTPYRMDVQDFIA